MKWFVTDAQLAAMRLAVGNQVWELARSDADRVRRQYDAEIQRLREDRAMELARLTDPQGPLVQHYEREVTFWRRQFLSERAHGTVEAGGSLPGVPEDVHGRPHEGKNEADHRILLAVLQPLPDGSVLQLVREGAHSRVL